MIVLHHQYVLLLHLRAQASVADVKKLLRTNERILVPYALANLNIIA